MHDGAEHRLAKEFALDGDIIGAIWGNHSIEGLFKTRPASILESYQDPRVRF